MKNKIIILSMILLLITVIPIETLATNGLQGTSEIEIDGNFNDWKDKPYVSDNTDDIKSNWLNFTEVRYYADDQYLYIYIERLSAKSWQPWRLNVAILNAEEGKKRYDYIPVEYEYDDQDKYYQPTDYRKTNYAQFEISTDYSYYGKKKGTPIKISFNGQKIETILLDTNNNKRIEFKIPLDKVGLDGENKEVKFMIKSAFDIWAYRNDLYPYDWVADGKPIIITTGPTYWQISSIPLFILVAFIVNKKYRKSLKTKSSC